jgi:copper(I)-binding protein
MLWIDALRSGPAARRSAAKRRSRRTTSLVVGVVLSLSIAGCAAGQISQTADQVAAIDGANGTVGQIGVRNALLATPTGAAYPKGASVPLWIWLSNAGVQNDRLTSVTTPAATAVQINGAVTLTGNSLLDLTGSNAKLTLTGLTATLGFGTSVPVTFVFATAGSLTINVPIQIPEQRTPGRPSIDIQPPEQSSVWGPGETGAPASGAAQG